MSVSATKMMSPLWSPRRSLYQRKCPPAQPEWLTVHERLIGAEVRPWLPGAFCAAAALPHLHPDLRRKLLQSISEAAATASGWSNRQPSFFPAWVEKVDTSAALPN